MRVTDALVTWERQKADLTTQHQADDLPDRNTVLRKAFKAAYDDISKWRQSDVEREVDEALRRINDAARRPGISTDDVINRELAGLSSDMARIILRRELSQNCIGGSSPTAIQHSPSEAAPRPIVSATGKPKAYPRPRRYSPPPKMGKSPKLSWASSRCDQETNNAVRNLKETLGDDAEISAALSGRTAKMIEGSDASLWFFSHSTGEDSANLNSEDSMWVDDDRPLPQASNYYHTPEQTAAVLRRNGVRPSHITAMICSGLGYAREMAVETDIPHRRLPRVCRCKFQRQNQTSDPSWRHGVLCFPPQWRE